MASVTAGQALVEGFLPFSLFDALEAGTRTFALECPCGQVRDLWEAGGIKGGGNQEWTWARCPACGERRWQHKRKKTPAERATAWDGTGVEPVFLSSHAWWASLLTWGSAAVMWALPFLILGGETRVLVSLSVCLVSFLAGWIGPYFWLTTRYRLGQRALQLRSGCFGRDLDYARITRVQAGRNRSWLGWSFAFDGDWLTIQTPGRMGTYSVSPRERQLFLEQLAARCPHLTLRNGELA